MNLLNGRQILGIGLATIFIIDISITVALRNLKRVHKFKKEYENDFQNKKEG